MSLEASGLKVVVESHGITGATDALNKLAVAGDKAERSTAKLAKSNGGVEAAAKKQEKVWYDLVHAVSRAKEQEYNALQRHNNRVYGLMQAEANRMNKQMDRITQQDAANFAKRRAAEQKQLEDLDTLRHKAAAKEYARAQAEGNRLNTLLDRQRKQQEAAAKASAERQRVQNATYSSSSLAQQIATLQRAQAYANQGGNVSSRYGSNVAGAMSSGELERLQRQYRQLQLEARRANATMADTHAAVRGLSGSLGALWLTYGNLLPLLGGAAIGMAVKGIVSVGSDIEHTLEKIRVLGGATMGEVDEMRKVIFDLGKGVQGPRDVAEAFSVLTLAGLNAKEALQGVGAALNLAIAGDVSIEKASSTLVQISTSLGYTAADFNHLADVVAKTAAASMSSVDSISGAFLSAAAVGEIYGASLKDIGVGLAAVANLGIQGTAAGTTLKNFYADLVKGTEKSTKALATMGLKIRDLKDDNGAMIDIVSLVTKLNDGLSKVNAQARTSTQDAAFGERGVKTFAALNKLVNTASTEMDQFGKVYKNRLVELAGEIERSAAFSTTAALAMSQTATNQMKSVGNTLQTTLGEAFAAIAPQIGQVARSLKAAFTSPEFVNGIKFIGTSIANLTVFVVDHAKQIAIMIAAYAGWKIGVFAAGLITMAKSFDIAKIAARGFTASLGPLGLAITALGVAWELYAAQKNKAITDNDANAGSLDEYAKGLKDAAENERKSLEMRRKGLSETQILRDEQLRADQAASQKLADASAEGVRAMKKSLDEQYNALSENERKRSAMVLRGETKAANLNTNNYLENRQKYLDAYNKHVNTMREIEANQNSLFKDRVENGKLADAAAKAGWIKPTGDGDVPDGDSVKAAKKVENFIQNEALELSKLTAGYEAKNAAMRQSIELGKHVAAEAQQAIILENLLAGKYGSKTKDNALYQSQMRLAMAADEAKAENEKLKKANEFGMKLSELEAASKAYNAEAIEGSMTHFGALRKEAEGLIVVLGLTGKVAEDYRKRSTAMDAYKKQQEAIIKLNSAADSSRNRAEEAKEEAEMMLKYGENTKLGAMAVAELVIQKSKLDDVTGNVAKSALREAAATEQLNTAYRDLAKQQIDLSKAVEDAQAESKLIFANSEAEKVKIAHETRKKLLAIEIQKVQDAYAAKKMAGTSTPQDYQIMMESYKVYLGNIEKSEQLSIQETSNLRSKGWKKSLDDIESIAREGFFNLSEKGVSIWSSMTSTFKNMFKTTVMEYIYKEFAKPLVLKVVASLAGVVGADGLAQAAGAISGNDTSSGGIGSLIGNVKNAYSVLTNGFAGIADSVSGGVQSVMSAFGYNPSAAQGLATAGGKAITPFAQGAGALASYAGGALAGVGLGRTISGGYSAIGGSGNTAVNVGTAVGAFMGPLGAAIGGAVGGLVNRAFGRGPKEVTAQGIRGTLSSDGTTGESYSNWMQKGGWFRSDKKGTDVTGLTEDVRNSFVSGLDSLKGSSSAFAQNLGISSDALKNYSKTFDITLTKDAEENQAAITKFFIDVGDDIATKLVPNIMNFAKQGESASVVLERLSNTFAATKNLADILGKSVSQLFGSDGLESANARTKLVDLSGGADALNSKASAYVNSIYTDAEKLAPVQKALAEAMKELGVSSITTKAEFKAYVETLNLTDESQIKLFNNLLELAPAFAQVADAAEAAADAAKEAAEKLAEANKLAMEKAFDAAGIALDRLSTAIDAEKDNIDAKYDMVIDKVKAAAEASVEAAEKQREAAEKQRDALKGVLDNITNALGSTVVESQELTRARRAEAQSYLAVSAIQARAGGSVTNMGGLNNALEMIAKPSEDLFSSFEAYARDQAMANFNLKSLQGSAQQELSAAELTIERLNATIESIELASENQIAALEKAREEEKAGLDNILNKAQQQLDALNGIDNSVMGVIAALNNFNASMAAVTATQIQQQQGTGAAIDSLYKSLLGRGADAGGKDYWTNAVNGGKSVVDISNGIKGSAEYQGKTIEDFYKSILGRNADTAGLAYWKERAAGGISLSEIEKTFRSSPEAAKKMGIPSYAVGTDYVPQDGLAMIHKGEMIVPATDAADIRRARTQSEASSEVGGLKAAIKELQQTVMAGDISKIQVDKELLRLLKKWDQEGQPEIRDVELENVA